MVISVSFLIPKTPQRSFVRSVGGSSTYQSNSSIMMRERLQPRPLVTLVKPKAREDDTARHDLLLRLSPGSRPTRQHPAHRPHRRSDNPGGSTASPHHSTQLHAHRPRLMPDNARQATR